MAWYEASMVLIGMGLLIASMMPIAVILGTLGKSRLHRCWQALRGLIVLFIIGYGSVLVVQYDAPTTLASLIVSSILMAGGIFVLVVALLSALTTADIVRIASLEADVVRDPLTEVFNRRYMDAVLPMALAGARRSRRPLSALLVDLDHFKHINDTYGHPVGDLVLKRVSNLIIQSSRASDMVVRYGGEEFLVIAPETSLDDAAILGERMRQRILVEPITLPNGRTLHATASIGVASLALDDDQDDLLARADEALYAAKAEGRNRVCFQKQLSDCQ